MTEKLILDMLKEVIMLTLMLSGPILLVTLIVGVIISILQAITQVQEATLTFVPKILAAFATLIFTAPWMLSTFVSHTQQLFSKLAQIIH